MTAAPSGLHIMHLPGTALVYGLDWHVVLGDRVRAEAVRLAARQGASRFVLSGEVMATVGLLAADTARTVPAACLAAAQLIAQHCPSGSVAVVLPLSSGLFWMAGAHDGAVIPRSDRLFASDAAAQQAVDALRAAYPALRQICADTLPPWPELAQDNAAGARLVRLPLWRRRRRGSAYGVGLGVACLLAAALLDGVGAQPSAQRSALAELAARTAWQDSLRRSAARHWVHGIAGTQGLRDALHALPVDLDGWHLSRAQCHARESRWDCRADYERRTMAASNAGFTRRAHPDWQIRFIPLEQAQVRWQTPAAGEHAGQARLGDARTSEHALFSALQAIRPALAAARFDAPGVLPVDAPLDDAGRAIPRPPGLPELRQRPVRLRAPLRSLDLVLPYCRGFGWTTAVLSLAPASGTGLRESRFILTLEGAVYEKEHSAVAGIAGHARAG